MARAHDGPMTPLTVGRNRVLSLCACCCDVAFNLRDVSVQLFPLSICLMLEFSFLSFCYSVIVRVISPRNVDPVLPGVEIFLSFGFGSSF